jgi:fatty-acyl-CoA synthase
VAFVARRAGAEVDAGTLMDFARQHIPERAAVPVQVTMLDELPVTSLGKVDKQHLRRMAAESVIRARLSAAGVPLEFSLEPGADLAFRLLLLTGLNDAEVQRVTEALAGLPVELRPRATNTDKETA